MVIEYGGALSGSTVLHSCPYHVDLFQYTGVVCFPKPIELWEGNFNISYYNYVKWHKYWNHKITF
jgi:hypothetical protein